MTIADRYLFPPVSTERIIKAIMWPISIMMVFHKSVVLGINGDRTDDFKPVYEAVLRFLHGQPVYAESYLTVEPHYLYPPSGTLLMAPIAYLDPERSRWVFIALSVAALVLSAYLLTRLFGYRASSWVFPTVLFFFFVSESVANTLIYTNFNSFVLLSLVGFLWFLRQERPWLAGIALGLTIAVKPVLLPVLLLALLKPKMWRALIPALGIPVVLNLIAWRMVVDTDNFMSQTFPYLRETRDYYNSSIGGLGTFYGLAPWLILVLRVMFVAMGAFGVWFLWRYYRDKDEVLWLTASSGILLATSFLVGPLGQGYYSMMLFPLVMTVIRPGSPMRNWPAWLGVYGCMTFDIYYTIRNPRSEHLPQNWEGFGRNLEYLTVTWGWSLLMIAVFFSLLWRYLDLRQARWPRVAATVEA
ncbi:arabinofuranan 3-O-arabinosyltransferase [Gordonia defluvii]|uniref:Arabinofuranan 3-O-arabinosyltransferase n=1 Tax=Gordonia defluvii TaxID=283718 RepID=A0ABP6LN75_9ACTN|nr:glycosyltransferase family 87 protein [Gordonia sp. UBA5067]